MFPDTSILCLWGIGNSGLPFVRAQRETGATALAISCPPGLGAKGPCLFRSSSSHRKMEVGSVECPR
jgi:hypothetical protein